MNLNIQIKLIIFSLIYGFLLSILLNINYKLLHHKNNIIRILSNFIFVFICIYIYFIIIQKICYGIFHIYSILLIITGFIIQNIISKVIEKYITKCYNKNN